MKISSLNIPILNTVFLALLASIGGTLFGAESQQADVVVVAATPGGVAAAVAAARSGARVFA